MARVDHLSSFQTTALPTPQDLIEELPLNNSQRNFIKRSRNVVQSILDGTDSRFLLIIGPCSIHDIMAAKEYAIKLQQLAESLSDTFYVVMRTYFEKPRTSLGWKGLLYDPQLDGSHDIHTGLRLTRRLLRDLTDIGIPTGAEFLDPASSLYFGDLITWGCIGARTAASQTHRQLASGLPMPVAFKNSPEGSIDVAINGVLNAAASHSFIGMNARGQVSSIQTSGNSHGHIVLRGGEGKPNYDPQSISYALDRLSKAGLPPRLLIDCSHDNSLRQHEQQCAVFQSVIKQVVEGNRSIRGILLESHLYAGNQPLNKDPSQLKYAVSLTDPCLDWPNTERLIKWGYAALQQELESQNPSSSSEDENIDPDTQNVLISRHRGI